MSVRLLVSEYFLCTNAKNFLQLSFLHRFGVSLFFDELFNFFVRLMLIGFVFLFDVWFQEFKIKLKTGAFFFHVLVVDSIFFLNENFDLSQALQSILRREKFVGARNAEDFFVEYYPLHTAEYATGF